MIEPVISDVVAFPPCYSIEHLAIAEHFVFGLLPGLTTFIRETTAIERAVGISDTHAFVTNGERGITRVYGHAISLN
jgi:hypothetical protein